MPNFAIKETAFSTITINYSWRTALHRDKGDLVEGFGNIIVLEDPLNKNTYKGGYTGFPQYGIAANIRHGDFMAMNVHEWHCNTEMKPIHKEVYGKWKQNEIDNGWYFNRLSLVCYLREKMIRCKNMDSNKIQLLKKNPKNDNLYNSIKKYDKPHNFSEYFNTLKKIENKIIYQLKKEVINIKIQIKLNILIHEYFNFYIYYLKEFKMFFSLSDKTHILNFYNKIVESYHTKAHNECNNSTLKILEGYKNITIT